MWYVVFVQFLWYVVVAELTAEAATAFLPRAKPLEVELRTMNTEQPPQSIRKRAKMSTLDTALLIYTSGTTGLPKAARVNHFSIIQRSLIFKGSMSLSIDDRLYSALPLYHTSGGNLAVGMMICTGATLYISRRFSTSKFGMKSEHMTARSFNTSARCVVTWLMNQ